MRLSRVDRFKIHNDARAQMPRPVEFSLGLMREMLQAIDNRSGENGVVPARLLHVLCLELHMEYRALTVVDVVIHEEQALTRLYELHMNRLDVKDALIVSQVGRCVHHQRVEALLTIRSDRIAPRLTL